MSDDRKVWLIDLPNGLDLPAEGQIMINQWGDEPPSIAVRRDRWSVWGPPIASEVAP